MSSHQRLCSGGWAAWAGRGAVPSAALGGGTHARGPRVSCAEQMAVFLSCRGAGWREQPHRKIVQRYRAVLLQKNLVGKVLWFALALHSNVGSASHFPLKVINLRNSAVALTLFWKGQSKPQVNVICFTGFFFLIFFIPCDTKNIKRWSTDRFWK